MPSRLLIAVTCAAILAACASAPKQTAASACAPRVEDSTYAKLGPVYRDCAVSTKAVFLTQTITPQFQPAPQDVRSGTCYSAELEYVVDEQGLVEAKTARVVKTNNPAFAESYLSILPQWKFEPAKLNGVPVRQIVDDKRGMQVEVVRVPAGQRPSSTSPRPPRSVSSC